MPPSTTDSDRARALTQCAAAEIALCPAEGRMNAAPSIAARHLAAADEGVRYVEACGCRVLSVHVWTHKAPEILVRDPDPLFAAAPEGAEWRQETAHLGPTVRVRLDGYDVVWIARGHDGASGERA